MPAPWQEDQFKVVVEFLKSSAGAKRTIQLKHSAAVVPPQLQGRISPQVWQAFMADIEQVGNTQRCSAACCCGGSIGLHDCVSSRAGCPAAPIRGQAISRTCGQLGGVWGAGWYHWLLCYQPRWRRLWRVAAAGACRYPVGAEWSCTRTRGLWQAATQASQPLACVCPPRP